MDLATQPHPSTFSDLNCRNLFPIKVISIIKAKLFVKLIKPSKASESNLNTWFYLLCAECASSMGNTATNLSLLDDELKASFEMLSRATCRKIIRHL